MRTCHGASRFHIQAVSDVHHVQYVGYMGQCQPYLQVFLSWAFFKDALSIKIDRMILRDMEANGRGLLEVQSWHLPAGTEENHKTSQSG